MSKAKQHPNKSEVVKTGTGGSAESPISSFPQAEGNASDAPQMPVPATQPQQTNTPAAKVSALPETPTQA